MRTYPVLGEERRSDTWYIPLVLPERLEFLWKKKHAERKKTDESVIRDIQDL